MKTEEIKRTSEKKGISLIVLVITIIVIIILAVAVILSIANNNPIENAKEARFKNDVKTMQEELELLKATNYAKNNGTSYEEIKITDLKSATNYTDDFLVKDGELKYIAKKLTGEEQTWASGLGVGVAEEIILKIWKEITYKKEQFYIIGGDEVGTEVTDDTQDILLLTKYNLKEENGKLKQDTSGDSNPCEFSSAAYWSSVEGIAYPADLNDVNKYPIGSATSIITKAQKYGSDLFGVSGRLMTEKEATKLQSEILYGNELNYWLGSANSENEVFCVLGGGGYFSIYNFDDDYSCGVRPVIKVSKSLLQ